MSSPPHSASWRSFSLALIILILLLGCATRSDSTSGNGQSPEQAEAIRHALVRALRFGMRSSQVLGWLGEPQTRTVSPTDPAAETWIYRTPLPPTYRTVAIEIQEVPWVDPISGEMKILREPLPGQQRIDGTEVLTLTFHEGLLRQIDRTLDERKTYSR